MNFCHKKGREALLIYLRGEGEIRLVKFFNLNHLRVIF